MPHNKESLEVLFRIVGADRCLVGSEKWGAGSAIVPATGRFLDDLNPLIENIAWLSNDERAMIVSQNDRKVFNSFSG